MWFFQTSLREPKRLRRMARAWETLIGSSLSGLETLYLLGSPLRATRSPFSNLTSTTLWFVTPSPFDRLLILPQDNPIEGMPGSQVGKVPVIRMFGVTNEGNSVCLFVHGVIPYFYVEAPPGFTESDCENFRFQLNVRSFASFTHS